MVMLACLIVAAMVISPNQYSAKKEAEAVDDATDDDLLSVPLISISPLKSADVTKEGEEERALRFLVLALTSSLLISKSIGAGAVVLSSEDTGLSAGTSETTSILLG